jgi:hypothetical protein
MGAFDPERILRALSKRRVRYVLVGATAARLQGFPRVTADADITSRHVVRMHPRRTLFSLGSLQAGHHLLDVSR